MFCARQAINTLFSSLSNAEIEVFMQYLDSSLFTYACCLCLTKNVVLEPGVADSVETYC